MKSVLCPFFPVHILVPLIIDNIFLFLRASTKVQLKHPNRTREKLFVIVFFIFFLPKETKKRNNFFIVQLSSWDSDCLSDDGWFDEFVRISKNEIREQEKKKRILTVIIQSLTVATCASVLLYSCIASIHHHYFLFSVCVSVTLVQKETEKWRSSTEATATTTIDETKSFEAKERMWRRWKVKRMHKTNLCVCVCGEKCAEIERKVTRISNRQRMKARNKKMGKKYAKKREIRSMRMILNIYIYNKYFVFLCCLFPFFFPSFAWVSTFHYHSRSYFSLCPMLLYVLDYEKREKKNSDKIQSKNISLFHFFFTCVWLSVNNGW